MMSCIKGAWLTITAVMIAVVLTGCTKEEELAPVPDLLQNSGLTSSPWITPPVNSPSMLSAEEANIADDAELVGVVLPSGPRAYLILALMPISSHVVNDVIDDKPVSITYCDRTDCVRVFTRAETSNLIDLKVAGLLEGEMIIMLDGATYAQSATDLPLEELEFVRTDWKTWYADHPDTLVYTGGQTADRKPTLASEPTEASEATEESDPTEESESTPESDSTEESESSEADESTEAADQ